MLFTWRSCRNKTAPGAGGQPGAAGGKHAASSEAAAPKGSRAKIKHIRRLNSEGACVECFPRPTPNQERAIWQIVTDSSGVNNLGSKSSRLIPAFPLWDFSITQTVSEGNSKNYGILKKKLPSCLPEIEDFRQAVLAFGYSVLAGKRTAQGKIATLVQVVQIVRSLRSSKSGY